MPVQQRGRFVGASSVRRVLGQGALGLVLGLLSWTSAAQVSVSSGGSPNYSQPIAVPPGISGMQPNLALFYAGGGVNGPVGHGWSVQGLSMITRCPASRYTDGAPRGVKFDANDKLCLDGQRLIQTDANGVVTPAFPQTNDALGLATGYREYRTEKDSFARIRAYGIANASDVNGPAYFKVWTKAGQIYEYGVTLTADANTKAAVAAQGKSVIMVWAVARISDVTNNYIDFKYDFRDVAWGSGPTAGSPTLGREWNIAEIQYTGNTAVPQLPVNKVIFQYSDRTLDKAEAYQQGSKNVSVRRLDAINTYVNSPNSTALGAAAGATLVKRTRLTYDTSGVTKRSRLASLKDCTDIAETKCLPSTTFNYSAGGSDAFTANASFNLTTAALFNNTGTMGVIPIDFDGDGKTDLLRWSDTPSQTQLWKSNGDGTFTSVATFNITTDSLFKSDRCFSSQVADFNGDGIPDLLRLMRASSSTGASCGTVSHKLYLGSSNGSFSAVAVAGIDFTQVDSVWIDYYNCIVPPSSGYVSGCAEPGTVYLGSSRTQGRNYYVLDLNGDGYLDIVTTILPAYPWTNPPPTDQSLCASTVCTRVYFGSATGAFSEFTSTNVANATLYAQAPSANTAYNPYILPSVVDADGDGLMDLAVWKGTYLSRGDGNFTFDPASTQTGQTCLNPVDFNGDGRTDCLSTSYGLTLQSLRVSDGTNTGKAVASFNLKAVGDELSGTGVGYQTVDVNGDGRTDILRWKDDATQNRVYLSNGDGSFTASSTFNLTTATTHQLAKSDGSTTFTLGDFLGNGSVQILRLKNAPTAGAATANQLHVKMDQTPPDQLVSVVGQTGLTTTLTN
jgi:FG-GAP-like repeat/Salmonella virulence plasmid 65kDa B protein